MSRRYSLDRSALLKILLHSAKYPTLPVCGYLLGQEKIESNAPASSPPSSPKAISSRRVLHIYDAVPIAHNYTTLTLPLEASLAQLQQYCGQNNNIRIVGYYQCNERLEDGDLGEAGKKIAARVEAAFPGSIALVMDGAATAALFAPSASSTSSQLPTPPFKLLHKDATRGWIHAPTTGAEASFTCPIDGIASLFAAYIAEGRHRDVSDFEDHLEDTSLDWLNPTLVA